MSTELAVKNTTGTLVISNMDDLARLGNMLAQSGYFTDAREAAQAGVKVLAGLEMGIGAFAAMSGIHIIEGKPSVGAGLMAAAVKRHPKYDYRVASHTTTECVIDFYEGGEKLGTSSFTIEDAKTAGLQFQTQKGYPTPWAKNPRNMLFARALSNGVRWYCPDVFDMSTYTPEELGAVVDEEGNVVDVTPAPAPEKPVTASESQPSPESPEPAQEARAEAHSAPTGDHKRLLDALGKRFKALGLDRTKSLVFARHLTGRELDNAASMTMAEAEKITGLSDDELADALDKFTNPPPEEES